MSLHSRMAGHGHARPGAGAHEPDGAGRRPWSVLALVSVAQFMVILDITVVNMALPSIGRALHLTLPGMQWVVTAYVLVTGGLTLVGGRASDLLGRRRTFLTGLGLFTAASLASGLAPVAGALIASRVAQGLGAAMLTPSALAVITSAYSGRQRATALSVWGALAGGGAAAGVLAGGVITTWLGWRWVFLINVPVGVAAAVLAPRVIRPAGPRPAGRGRLDLAGAVLAVAGLAAGVYAVTGAPQYGWASARTLGLLAAAAVLLAAFTVAGRTRPDPLLPPGTLRSGSLSAGLVVMLAGTGVLVGVFFLGSLYLQGVLGLSPALAGAGFLPLLVMTGAGTHLTGRLAHRAGTRLLAVAGLGLLAAGALLLSRGGGYGTWILPGFVLIGAGTGVVLPAASVTAMAQVRHGDAGLASGLLTTAHEIGAALGVAVFSVLASASTAATAGGAGFAAGYRHAFTVAAVVAAVLALAAGLVVPAVRPAAGAKVTVH
jgi:EmrB/QacA subfamily drug resistance transporter